MIMPLRNFHAHSLTGGTREISPGRLKLLRLFYYLLFAAVAVRLFYWQVLRFDDLSAMADQQHLVNYTLQASRGTITSADGAVLATNRPSFLLYGLPEAVKNPSDTAAKLAAVLAPTPAPDQTDNTSAERQLKEELQSDLSQALDWVTLSKNVDLPTRQEIEKMNVPGLGFESQLQRFYPEASTAAHVLGFVGSDASGQPTGYFGLEGYYNGELTGVGGEVVEEKDAQGFPIAIGRFSQKDAQSGRNLLLNINSTVQYIVEKHLKEGMEKYGARSGTVIVMEPKTGAILAMASFPDYDPNNFSLYAKNDFLNPAVADSYEPGSTFKPLVMAAAINEGLITPETTCDSCSGPVKIDNYYIRTWNDKYFPETTMRDVLIHSDNTGMVFVSRKLGLDKTYDYIQKFGFGAPTQIDLQDESSPTLRPKNEWGMIDLATASFGQGIAVTPIQLVRAMAAIANGGYLMQPQVVHAVQIGNAWRVIQPKVVSRPISSQTAATVTAMMVDAVSKGEAKFFALKGFNIAGKTGTAQIPVAGHYDPTKTIASFVGFAPAEDPKFVMLVEYEQPSSSIYGAETAAPTFFDIAKELLAYYNIAPSY